MARRVVRFRRRAPRWPGFAAGVGLALVLSSAASCLLPEARLLESEEARERVSVAEGGAAGSTGGTGGATAAGGANGARNEAGAAAVLIDRTNAAGAEALPTERDAGQSSPLDGGGGCSGACGVGEACVEGADCESGVCAGLGCAPGASGCCEAPSCDDGVTNGTETGVDCGGNGCQGCSDLTPCAQDSDCANANCANGICISCGDGILDGTETDVDCGGDDPFCQRCLAGQRCGSNTDCASGGCFDGFCS